MHDNTAALVAAASQVLLALLGVDYYSLLWAFVGSLVGLGQAQRKSRSQAILYVLLSTMVGAALGSGLTSYFSVSARSVLLLACLVAGAGAHVIVTALVRGAVARIRSSLGGDSQ